MDDYSLYDKINTTAANWLRLYRKNVQMPLGIRDFGRHNKFHIWVLKMIDMVSLVNGYEDYYVGCNWIDWIIFRYIKHFRHMKRLPKKSIEIAFIDVPVFVDEVCAACEVKPVNIETMFDGYWRV